MLIYNYFKPREKELLLEMVSKITLETVLNDLNDVGTLN